MIHLSLYSIQSQIISLMHDAIISSSQSAMGWELPNIFYLSINMCSAIHSGAGPPWLHIPFTLVQESSDVYHFGDLIISLYCNPTDKRSRVLEVHTLKITDQ